MPHICTESSRLTRIEDKCDQIEKSLNGNGKPGMKMQIHDLQAYRDADIERRREQRSRNWAFIMLAASNISFTVFYILREALSRLWQ